MVERLGLQWRDLFVPGHRQHRLRPRPRPTRRGPIEVVLEGLELLGIGYGGLWIAERCPYCGAGGLWVRMNPGQGPSLECAEGCPHTDIVGTLEAQVAIAERTLDPAGHGRAAPPPPGSWWARAPEREGGGDA